MLERLRELAASGQDFAFETTLSSRSFYPFLKQLRERGYELHLVYVWLRSADMSVERVASRVQRGGHNVPEEAVRLRYGRGVHNFFHLYRPIADAWVLCDNSDDEPLIVARGGVHGPTAVFHQERYDEIERSRGGERNKELAR
jgi:predicted ABC-type ATPase